MACLTPVAGFSIAGSLCATATPTPTPSSTVVPTPIPSSTVVVTVYPPPSTTTTVVVVPAPEPTLEEPIITGKTLDQAGSGEGSCSQIVYGEVGIDVNVMLWCLTYIRDGWPKKICEGYGWAKHGVLWHDPHDCWDACVRCMADAIKDHNVISIFCGYKAGLDANCQMSFSNNPDSRDLESGCDWCL